MVNSISYATDVSNDIRVVDECNEKTKNLTVLSEKGKENFLIPSPYSITVPDVILEDLEGKTSKSLVNNLRKASKKIVNFSNGGTSIYDDKYDLRDTLNIEVKNQGDTYSCWALSLISSVETNIQLTKGVEQKLSARHMDFSTSKNFYDGINENAYNRRIQDGGSILMGLAYLTNGSGVVLEEQMPFSFDMEDISVNDINIKSSMYVKGYNALPIIYKVNNDGKIFYTDGYGKNYTDEEVSNLRNVIKEHIIKNGAITAYIAGTQNRYYNGNNILDSTAYYCNDISTQVDHAVTIIGWDDNYSRENFRGVAKPSKDGAYIVLNSYSDKTFDNGCMYVSYEDVWIETMLYGITEVSEIDYDNLYQHNKFGAIIPVTLSDNNMKANEGYYASIYKRKNIEDEVLTEVSVATNQYAKFEVYINPNGTELNINNLIKVATTEILNPGYNTVSFEPVILDGENFAVVIKQISIDEAYYFMLEAKVEGTFYENISANQGDSKVSLNGLDWIDLTELGSLKYEGYDINLENADVCIKAFTKIKSVNLEEQEYDDSNILENYNKNTNEVYVDNINKNYEESKNEVYEKNTNTYIENINKIYDLKNILFESIIVDENLKKVKPVKLEVTYSA